MINRKNRVALMVLGSMFLLSSMAFAGTGKVSLKNLMDAYNGESNARAKYLAYAKKADEEGYKAVGSLFRAAARAEEVHAGNHAKVIAAMGGKAKADIKLPKILTTKENLLAAVAGETYERDTMYPGFIKTAKMEGNIDALRSFNYAKTAEAEHASMYQSAADNLDSLKDSQPVTYYVCTVCGFTTANMNFDKCPSCYQPKHVYEEVK